MGSEAGADAALVRAAQAGDARAFGELYVSEVFLKAMESLARYRDQGLPFIAFLYRVARNAAIDRSPQG